MLRRRLALLFCALLLPVTGLAATSPAAAAPPAPDRLETSSTDAADIPTLSWSRVAGATKYDVQVSASSGFATNLWSLSGTVNLSAVPNKQLPNGELWFRVRAIGPSGSSEWASQRFVRQRGDGPDPLSPANGATLHQPEDPVLLSWSPSPGAEEYVVEVSPDAGFTEPALIEEYETETTTLVRPDQEAARRYYWRVAGVLAAGVTTHWSPVRSYTLAPLPPAELVAPADGADLPPVEDVVLDWEPVPGATSYDVEVSLVPDFSTIVSRQSGVLGTRYSPPSTLKNNQYYWRVRAEDVFGNLQGGDVVTTWSFRRAWAEQPELQYPGNGDIVGDPFFFQWSPVRQASRYALTVTGPGVNRTCTTTQTTYTPTGRTDCWPQAAGTYSWHVIAIDDPVGIETGPVDAQVGTFSYLPSAVQPTAPLDGAEVSVPTMRWEPLNGAAEYDVVLTNTTTGSVTETTTRATSFTPRSELPEGSYRWYVQSVSDDGRLGPELQPEDQRTFTVDASPQATASSPEPTLPPAAHGRFPTLTWTPVVGATHYKLQVRRAGAIAYTELTTAFHYPAGEDHTERFLPAGDYEWRVQAYDESVFLSSSQTPGRFTIAPRPRVTGQRIAMVGTESGDPATTCARTIPASCEGVRQTPVFRWDPEPDTAYYEFYLSHDRELTNLVTGYPREVHGTSYTPDVALPDVAAGQAYHWGVRPCTGLNVCGGREYPDHSFNKLGNPVLPLSPGIPLAPGGTQDLPSLADDITFTWEDYLATNASASHSGSSLAAPSRVEARSYRIQVADNPQFTRPIDDVTVDQTTFTSFANTYPESQLYWRVQAIDGSRNPLPWSPTWTFDKQSPVPELVGPAGNDRFDGSTPLRWRALDYASAYDVEIYRNGDTKPDAANLVDDGTFAQTAVSWDDPVEPAAEPYTWRVRRVDADGWRGDWSEWMSYRVSTVPVQLHSPASGIRVAPSTSLFSWAPVTGAADYRWERRAAGSSSVSTYSTPALAHAPTSTLPDGEWEWRVVALDTAGKQLGASEWRTFTVAGAPQAITAPQISGSGEVGALLTSSDPTWDLADVSNSYQWLRNSATIAGATTTTYEVTSADLGKNLTLRVTGQLAGYRDAATVSNPVAAVAGPAPTTATPPSIDGTGRVGTVVELTPPSWNESGVTMTYRWLRDGAVISGQTKATYTVATKDVGSDLVAEVTGTKSGYAKALVTSNTVRGVPGEGPVNTARPAISGTRAVGSTLTATTGTWDGPSSPSYGYQWQRGGAPIAGATSRTYRVAPADAGTQVTVEVTARKTGFTDGTAQSEAVSIGKLKAGVTSSPVPAKVRRGVRAKMRIEVAVSGVGAPTGTLAVLKGRRTLTKVKLIAARSGRLTIKLPALPVGKHRLKTTYSGNQQIRGASRTATLTVKRR